MSQVGRIGGQVLTDNLLRAGVDLAFETDLLYLDVNNQKISIRQSPPIYDLDVNSNIVTADFTVSNQINFDPNGINITAPYTFSTQIGGIDIFVNGPEIFHDRLITSGLELQDNFIGSISNGNVIFDPNGTGTTEIFSNTEISQNLTVGTVSDPKNINITGDLSGAGKLTLGDQTFDTITVNTDFTQSIIPGDDLLWSLGENTGDSSPRRWSQLFVSDWTKIEQFFPQIVTISDQMSLNGITNKISAIQSNEDILLTPDTGITIIEKTQWQDNDITNLINTPITFSSTGRGYFIVAGTNALQIPAGTDAERRASPEIGETRWNTDQQYLECFDGTVWAVSIGGSGGTVSSTDMDDLSNIYTLILG